MATLIVGALIGLLIPGFFHKYRSGMQHRHGGHNHNEESKKEWFSHTIDKIVQPDSNQVEKIKPITDWASQQIEAVEISSNEQMSDILDSVKVQLMPFLSDEQQKRLTEFQGKAHGKWKGDRNRRR
jgi:hypothetical protein